MTSNSILQAIDNPEEAAFLAARRQARRRVFLAILAVVGAVTLAVSWKVTRHFIGSYWLQANHYMVSWNADGKKWKTGGSTSVKFVQQWSMSNNAQGVTDLSRLALLHRLEELDLSGAVSLTDADLEVLDRLTELRTLNLDRTIRRGWLEVRDTYLTDAMLARVQWLRNLKDISVGGQAITDDGLANLAGLSGLEYVDLHETATTDAGLEHLKALPRLKSLNLFGTKVTAQGVKKFEATHPDVKIMSDTIPNPSIIRID
jgi:hypothetical protein